MPAAKRLPIRDYDKNGDEELALSYSDEEGVSHSQSVDQDQSRTASQFEKLEEAIKKDSVRIPITARTSWAISGSLTIEFIIFEETGEKSANISKRTAAFDSIPSTSVEAEMAFSAEGCLSRELELV